MNFQWKKALTPQPLSHRMGEGGRQAGGGSGHGSFSVIAFPKIVCPDRGAILHGLFSPSLLHFAATAHGGRGVEPVRRAKQLASLGVPTRLSSGSSQQLRYGS